MSTTASPPAAPRARSLVQEHLVLALSLAYMLVVGPFVPGFATAENLASVASNLGPLLVLAVGQMFVLISGGIDLSATAVVGLASVVGASLATAEGGPLAGSPLAAPAAVGAMVGLGVIVGAFNGVGVGRLGMPPFLATLATMMVVGGLAVWYANRVAHAEAIGGLPAPFLALGREPAGRIAPGAALIAVGVTLAAHGMLRHTLSGRWLYAVGRNSNAAAVAGVPVAGVVIGAYAASGACAGVAAILYTARLETGLPEWSGRILLDVIAAAVLGGTSLFGGRGTAAGTAAGVLFITLVDNGLNLGNLSNFQIMIVKGVVILLAALLDAARARARLRAGA